VQRKKELLNLDIALKKNQQNEEFWQYVENEWNTSLLKYFDENAVKQSVKKQLKIIAFNKVDALQHFTEKFKNLGKNTQQTYQNYDTKKNQLALTDVENWCKNYKFQFPFLPPNVEKETIPGILAVGAMLCANFFGCIAFETALPLIIATGIIWYSINRINHESRIENREQKTQVSIKLHKSLADDFFQSVEFKQVKIIEPKKEPEIFHTRFLPKSSPEVEKSFRDDLLEKPETKNSRKNTTPYQKIAESPSTKSEKPLLELKSEKSPSQTKKIDFGNKMLYDNVLHLPNPQKGLFSSALVRLAI
jgi:hypothetical protein